MRLARIAVVALVIFALIGVGLVIYGSTSSLRYGPNSREFSQVKALAESGNVEGLNAALLSVRSLSTKLVIMSYLKEFKDDSSIPVLVQMLSFDLPWYEKLDSELQPRPENVRFAAHSVLASYGPEPAERFVTPLLSSDNIYQRIYAAGILMRWGNPKGEEILATLIRSQAGQAKEEAAWVLRMAQHRSDQSP